MIAEEREWFVPPRTEAGRVHVVQLARDLSHYCSRVGNYITDTATILEEMRDELPKRGHLVDLYVELVETMRRVETAWDYADDALLTAATLVGIEARHASERRA